MVAEVDDDPATQLTLSLSQLTLSLSQLTLIETPPVCSALSCATIYQDEIPTPLAERHAIQADAIWIKQIGIVDPIFTIPAFFPVD